MEIAASGGIGNLLILGRSNELCNPTYTRTATAMPTPNNKPIFFFFQLFILGLYINLCTGKKDVPMKVAINSDTNKIYLTNTDSNTVTVIDGNTNRIIDINK